ncbi:MAG: hypothetical protein SF069_12365 [Phycisphaerae bacterium]|nr:hypothetical protein [Phycisphaerae bacterium]
MRANGKRTLLWTALLWPSMGLAQAFAQSQFHFSTERDFAATKGPAAGQLITQGDECRDDGERLLLHAEMVANFCPEAVSNFGVDALHRTGILVWFSTEQSWFDECLNQLITDGDLLNIDGGVITNAQLLFPFALPPPLLPPGLDAVHLNFDISANGGPPPNNSIWFSIEDDAFSGSIGVMLQHGDILSTNGTIVATNQELIQNFCPKPVQPDVGLDALYLPRNGEIWFSIEDSFFSECLGLQINEGDLLSNAGYVVKREADLLAAFGPIVPGAQDAGLDAIWIDESQPLQHFSGCGTLAVGPQGCIRFEDDGGVGYFIQNTGPFLVGARVWVDGSIDPQSHLCAPFVAPAIIDNSVAQCFEDCGVLVAGAPCVQLQTDTGELYDVQNLGSFGPGDEVWVTGAINPNSQICPPLPAAPGIESNTIGRCFKDCGEIRPGPQGCPVFVGSSSDLLFIENVGNLPLDEPVWVTGCLNPESRLCLPFVRPGIEDNRVGRCIEVCGLVAPGPECVLLQGDDGVTYWVESLIGASIGARVRIRGSRGPDITPCLIDLPFPSIVDNELVLLGDLNCDGAVAVGDIAGFVLAITNPAAYPVQYPSCDMTHADINCDGFVTVGDIGPFVRLLTGS